MKIYIVRNRPKCLCGSWNGFLPNTNDSLSMEGNCFILLAGWTYSILVTFVNIAVAVTQGTYILCFVYLLSNYIYINIYIYIFN